MKRKKFWVVRRYADLSLWIFPFGSRGSWARRAHTHLYVSLWSCRWLFRCSLGLVNMSMPMMIIIMMRMKMTNMWRLFFFTKNVNSLHFSIFVCVVSKLTKQRWETMTDKRNVVDNDSEFHVIVNFLTDLLNFLKPEQFTTISTTLHYFDIWQYWYLKIGEAPYIATIIISANRQNQ